MTQRSKGKQLNALDSKAYSKATVIFEGWHWCTDRTVEQQNRTESPQGDPHLQENLMYDRDNITNQWGKE